MSGLLPSFLRGGPANSNGNNMATNSTNHVPIAPADRNGVGVARGSDGGGSNNAQRRPSTQPASVSPEEWSRRLQHVNLAPNDVNVLLMNYLVIEGYKEAAERFSQESGLHPAFELKDIEERMRIRAAIQQGALHDAVNRINELDADLLDSHPKLAFRLKQQQVIELIREGRVEEALEEAQEELAPRALRNPEFLRDLERTMTLLVYGGVKESAEAGSSARLGADLMETAQRLRVANEVNAALLAMQSQEHESKLPMLMRKLHRMQEAFGTRSEFPKIVDFQSARFEPPITS